MSNPNRGTPFEKTGPANSTNKLHDVGYCGWLHHQLSSRKPDDGKVVAACCTSLLLLFASAVVVTRKMNGSSSSSSKSERMRDCPKVKQSETDRH